MPTHNVQRSTVVTLDGTDPDDVNLLQPWDKIEVRNASTTHLLSFTFDGTVPVSLGDDTTTLGPSESVVIHAHQTNPATTSGGDPIFHTIRLIGQAGEIAGVEGVTAPGGH
jgi:hypothetical protein